MGVLLAEIKLGDPNPEYLVNKEKMVFGVVTFRQFEVLDIGPGERHPGRAGAVCHRERKFLIRIDEIVHGQPPLLERVLAGAPAGRFPGRLHGRQEQPHERADDRDHDQQFDQREAPSRTRPKTRPKTRPRTRPSNQPRARRT